MSTGRKYLTPSEREAMLQDQGGVCAGNCGRTPEDAAFEADHSTPNAIKSGKPDQLLCRPCHLEKTRTDRRIIAKVMRIFNKHHGIQTRKKKKIPSRELQSRPFYRKRLRENSKTGLLHNISRTIS